jgi:hypothetical protein
VVLYREICLWCIEQVIQNILNYNYFKIIIIIRVNYSKTTSGLARFNIVYPWFKTYHFTHLKFKTLAAVTHLAQFR